MSGPGIIATTTITTEYDRFARTLNTQIFDLNHHKDKIDEKKKRYK